VNLLRVGQIARHVAEHPRVLALAEPVGCGDRRDRAGGSSDEEAHIPMTVDGQVDESMVGVSGSA
jgi:hypothetical protein